MVFLFRCLSATGRLGKTPIRKQYIEFNDLFINVLAIFILQYIVLSVGARPRGAVILWQKKLTRISKMPFRQIYAIAKRHFCNFAVIHPTI
jgi:hypothetical protein